MLMVSVKAGHMHHIFQCITVSHRSTGALHSGFYWSAAQWVSSTCYQAFPIKLIFFQTRQTKQLPLHKYSAAKADFDPNTDAHLPSILSGGHLPQH